MTLPKARSLATALIPLVLVLVNALVVLGIVHWSNGQVLLVNAEAVAVIGLALALYAHFFPDTKREPVLIAAAVTATLVATLNLLNGFEITDLSREQIEALVAAVGATAAFGTALLARAGVTATTTITGTRELTKPPPGR